MNEIRGEKVVFRKQDYHPLDAMPSVAQRDAAVLAVPRSRHFIRRLTKLVLALVLLGIMAVGLLFVALEGGYLDQTLRSRATQALSNALGDEFEPEVGAIRLRFAQNWMLAFEAADLKITHRPSRIELLKTDSIKAVLDPVALLGGRLALARLEIGSAEGDLRFLPASAPIDWKSVRVDAVPGLLQSLYPQIDQAIGFLERSNTKTIVAGELGVLLPSTTALGSRISLSDLKFENLHDNHYEMTSTVRYGKLTPSLTLKLDSDGEKATAFNIAIAGLETEPFLLKHSPVTDEIRQGLDLPISLSVSSERDRNLTARIAAGKGLFYADGEEQLVKGGRGVFSYDFREKKIRLMDGVMDFGATVVPLEGTLIDLDRVSPGKPTGIAFEAIGNDAIGNAEGSGEAPEKFNARVAGYYLPLSRELQLDTIGIVTSSGNFAGSLNMQMGQSSPAINFAARADTLSVATVKQLWPFWFGKKARHWILTNIRDGVVKNAVIDVSLAAGRIPEHPEPLLFDNNEMHIAFDAEGLTVQYVDTMPESRGVNGHFDLTDRKMRIDISQGLIDLPSGKRLAGSNGVFEIADTAEKPLAASLDIKAAGEAAAAAEFSTYKPINAMSRFPVAPADLTGKLTADIHASFGLDHAPSKVKPDWKISLDLNKVGLKTPFDNRKITNVEGRVAIDTEQAIIKGKADVDGINFDVAAIEPIDKEAVGKRDWQLDGKVSRADILKLAPTLSGYFSGSMDVSLQYAGKGKQKATLSLTSADLSIPLVGWRKGPGVPAKAQFEIASADGRTEINNLVVSGDGFGAQGDMNFDPKGLVSAKLNRVRLAASDNFALSLARKGSGLSVAINGESIDMRTFLDLAKSGDKGDENGKSASSSNSVSARIDRAIGYNNESLTAVNIDMAMVKGSMSALNFSAVTRSGQAVVIRKGTEQVEVTSGDAGAVARFADIYRNMHGGLLNVNLKAKDAESWRGSVDIRNFALVNDARLKSIVSARAGADGRSLSDAVKADIDVSSQKFRRGFARLVIDGKVVRVENGVVRGDEVGATFQGTVRDDNGLMAMTGTFMPAYGINRLFSELPLIGVILGNGSDRGLLGITFKLVGPFEQPALSINPLSLIAPGVFRNIFEFE